MQEGWVAIWREVKAKGSLPDGWLKNAAICRMRSVARNDTRQCRDVRNSVPCGSLSSEEDEFIDLIPAVEVDLLQLQNDYHHGEIVAAMNKLTIEQRQYVERRIWYGWGSKELNIQYDNSIGIWRSAKTQLRKELAHLGVK